MKLISSLLALVALAGCYKNNPDANSPFNKPNPGQQNPGQQVGFTKHAWCYAYPKGARSLQERFMFNNGGSLDYREFDWIGGQRGQQTFQAAGTWLLSGSVLQMDINGAHLVYQIGYSVNDPVTRRERVHIYMNGTDAPYDPCF